MKHQSIILTISFLLIFNGLFTQNNHGLYFVFLNTNPDKTEISEEKIKELQAAHLKNIGRLAEEGIMKAAGPFEGGGGLFILKTKSLDKANEILYTDPAIKANRFKLEVFPFETIINNVCAAEEPYEMVTYQFVRLIPDRAYFGEVDLTKHENKVYFSKLNKTSDFVVVYGSYGDADGGMLILDVEEPQKAVDIISGHPLVETGHLNFEIRSLWIAKGTFCKK